MTRTPPLTHDLRPSFTTHLLTRIFAELMMRLTCSVLLLASSAALAEASPRPTPVLMARQAQATMVTDSLGFPVPPMPVGQGACELHIERVSSTD